MSLEKLKTILSIPDKIYGAGDIAKWKEAEKELGTKFPSDYKEFISIYGTGGVCGFLWIYSPFSSNENLNFFIGSKEDNNAYFTSKQEFPDDFPRNLFPEEGGLLPWGVTDNGDVLNWITSDNPEKWSILVYEGRSGVSYEYKNSLAEFLYDVWSGNITCHLFPEDLLENELEYIVGGVD
ncbi:MULTISPECIES: SMI1/KNR4 family protein [unclassified Lysinibacillus]|uniref:SMI1/KNR4 family protein n=1 Tax=unclassified Lysinibacillus TaxID=2636778 RepID=UPI0025529615|nr:MULTISPECIES: SMI1/KNR4 family protein [unclassified Lysinibacillus]MDM5247652.1 SMI1/KNR4 family protein [Lysinibacillus sp. G4S2]